MDKTNQIWYRLKHDHENLKKECVDLVSMCYLMLGQKPDKQQVVLMAQMLFNDLVQNYSSYTVDKVKWIFEQGIKYSDEGNFFNVRNYNKWLREYKTNGEQQTNYKNALEWNKQNDHLLANTINKAKRLK